MTQVTVKVEGLEQVINDVGEMPKGIEAPIRSGLTKIAFLARSAIQRLILSGPKTGKIYRHGKTIHQASAPGEPPASDTGALVASVYAEPVADELSVVVVVRKAYAAFLEFGTRLMAARPFVRPGCQSVAKDGARILAEEVANWLKSYAKK